MSSEHTRKKGNGKTKAELVRELKDLQDKFDLLNGEHRRKEGYSEEKYRQIVETAGEGIWVLDNNAVTVSVNARMADMLGYTVEELIGKNAFDFVFEEDLEKGKQIAAKAINDVRGKVECRYRKKDGSPLWAIVSSQQLFDANGNHTGSFAMFTDITERKQIEAALKKSESSLAEAQRIGHIGSWEWNIRTGEVRWSAELYSIYGVDPNTFIPTISSFAEYIHPDDRESVDRSIDQIMSEGVSVNFDFRIVSADGSTHVLNTVGEITDRDENGKPRLMVGVNQDITERKRAEEALRESEEHFRKLFMSMNEGFYLSQILYDDDGRPYDYRYVEVNHAFEQIIGLSRDQIIGKRFTELVPNYSSRWMEIFISVALTGTPVNDGFYSDTFRQHLEIFAYRPVEGQFAVLVTDVTERKRAEEALGESEERYRAFFESSMDAILITTPDVGVDAANAEACRMFGMTEEELIKGGREAIVDMSDPRLKPALEERARTGRFRGELNFKRKDGTIFPVDESNVIFTDRNGCTKTVMIIRDITERKRAEEALRESEDTARQRAEELEKLMDLVPVAIWVSQDPQCNVITGNRAANRFYEAGEGDNVSAGPATGGEQDMTRRFYRNGMELRPDELTMQEAVAKGVNVLDSELEVLLPSGRWMTILGNASPLKDADGNVRGCIGAFIDITGRKRAEEELLDAKMQAELYLDLMGHDISNMHQIAIGQLEMAKETMDEACRLESEDKELIETPLETLVRSARLIDNVRNLQKQKAGEFREECIDLDDLLSSIVKEYSFLVPANSIKFMGNGPHHVMANKLLHDVFANLVSNAIKHSNGNSIEINIKLENASDNGRNYYKVSVEDNGPGIPDDLKEKIFNRLQRGQTKARGLGLGLYLVKSLVESYHGKVYVEDRVKGDRTNGSRFVVLLPAVEGSHGS